MPADSGRAWAGGAVGPARQMLHNDKVAPDNDLSRGLDGCIDVQGVQMTRQFEGTALLRALAVAALFCVPLAAQIETARITGTISDSTGAVIPGAEVKFIHVATAQELVVQSSAEGLYRSQPLRIGEYRMEVEADGFKRAVRSGIVLTLQQTARIDIMLELGAVTEVVDVTAAAPLLETTEATQGQVITNERIVDMPLNGRDYIQLALLSAGATRSIGGRFGGYSAGGQRTTQNNYTLDGIDNNGRADRRPGPARREW